MTRVLRDQSINGRPRQRRARAEARAYATHRYRRLSWEERLERRETIKTYLLGLVVIALITAAIVVTPAVRGELPADGAGAGGAPVTVPEAQPPAEEDDTDQEALDTGAADAAAEASPTESGEPELARVEIDFGSESPAVTFERSEPEEYLVEDGETLSQIAAFFDLQWDYLAEFNGLSDPDRLHPGQRILIPPEHETLLEPEKL